MANGAPLDAPCSLGVVVVGDGPDLVRILAGALVTRELREEEAQPCQRNGAASTSTNDARIASRNPYVRTRDILATPMVCRMGRVLGPATRSAGGNRRVGA